MIDYKARKCAECGVEFVPHSVTAKYCPRCVPSVYRRKHRERVARWRARIREAELAALAKARATANKGI